MRQFVVFSASFCGVLATLGAIACLPPKPLPTSPSAPLLTITYEGGMRACTQPNCENKLTLEANGTFNYQDVTGRKVSGTIAPDALQNLKQQMAQANFSQIKAKPFKGTCPIAYDGTKSIYTFYASTPTVIDSCEVEVNPANPLFQQADAIAQQAQQLAYPPEPAQPVSPQSQRTGLFLAYFSQPSIC